MPTPTSDIDGDLLPAVSHEWIDIQAGTFTQWVNQHLNKTDQRVKVLHEDLSDGVLLVALLESLQSRNLGRVFANPITDIQKIENVNRAFRALSDQGIRLVNIGPEDIVAGNQKLILGLVWHLILSYQIGTHDPQGKMQPKKRMLAWLQAALPGRKPTNFTTHWNDGQSLLALIDYCKPGVVQDKWRLNLGPDDGLRRCRLGLETAEKELRIPPLLSAEALNSAKLDELSAMTYLSYFLGANSPGYDATLAWVNDTLKGSKPVKDFKGSWRDGVLMCQLLVAMGYKIPGWPESLMRSSSSERIRAALAVARNQLDAKFDFAASDIESDEAHHLIMMTFATHLRTAGPAHGNGYVGPVEIEPQPVVGTISSHNAPGASVGDTVACSLVLEEAFPSAAKVEFRYNGPGGLEVLPKSAIQWDVAHRRANFHFDVSHEGRHTVQAVASGLRVEPFSFSVLPEEVRVRLPDDWSSGEERSVEIEASGASAAFLAAEWRDPEGRRHELELERDERTGRMKLRAKPDRPGSYELFVSCNGRPVTGSPFPLTVRSGHTKNSSISSSSSSSSSSHHSISVVRRVSSSKRTTLEPVKEPVSLWVKDPVQFGRESNLIVRSSEADGEISSLVTRNGIVVASSLTERDKNGTQAVRFLPDEPGDYRISVFHQGQEVANTIFSVHPDLDPAAVHCSGSGLDSAQVNREERFRIHAPLKAFREKLEVKLTAPSGNRVDTSLRESSEHLEVEYTLREAGEHHLEVLLSGNHVTGSPFKVFAFDPAVVRVELESRVKVGQKTEISVRVGEADRVPVECVLRPPSGKEQNLQRLSGTSRGQHRFGYIVQEAGLHYVSVRFAGTTLPGAPFVQTAEEMAAQPRAYGAGLEQAQVGVPAEFFVDPKGGKGDLSVQVDGPDSITKCNIEPEIGGRYRVVYVPPVVGQYSVNVSWNNISLPNSPYRPVVVDVGAVRCSELRASSDRPLEPLVVGRKKELLFSTTGAGAGLLRAAVEDASGKSLGVRVKRRAEEKLAVTFTPERTGPHKLTMHWADIDVPGSPFFGMATADQALDHTKIILSGRGLKEARVNEEAEFVIDAKHAGPGAPIIHMKGVRTEQPVKIDSIMERRYRCSYTPQIPGAYLLTIWWSERQLRGSPFKVTVIAPSDASKVVCSGDGLSHGILGSEPMECFIDTQHAGPGELTAHCSGPNKVAYCELYDRRDGTYILKIRPQETGRHVLQVKFDGEHVRGSPFISRVSHAPDASQVRVYGPGVESGVLSTFQSRFHVETRGAGAGQLTVRVRGPRGGFRVEMERETRADRTILCRYDPTEVGEYAINVAWSGVAVPGSPFRVMLCHNEAELANYCRDKGLALPQRGQWQAQL